MNIGDNAIARPADEADAAEIIKEAVGRKQRLDIVGGGTRAGLGRPREAARGIATTGLAGIIFHEPAEMVIAAQAGTPVATIERALSDHGQILPFEPMDHRAIYATTGEPTIGALVAANVSGPRRINAGAARDSLIGVRLVNGRGEIVKSGGRVMKNVTGLDLVKLNCGAHGTLGLLTEVTFKVLPRPETEVTLVIPGLDDARAIAALTRALGSPFGVSGAAALPDDLGGESRALLRVDGFADSVAYRLERLRGLVADLGEARVLRGEDSSAIWRAIRDAEFLMEPRERALWRVSLAPSQGPPFVAQLGRVAGAHFYDWGGGLVWLATEASEEAAAAVRAATAHARGHATLVRAPDALRAVLDVFEPLSDPLMRITRGVKASCDPAGLFNYGRMYRGV